MIQKWMWTPEGEIDCAGCGCRYQVMTARGNRRRFDYFRCEVCDEIVDEWIDTAERTHLRISEPTKAKAAELDLAVAAAG